MKVQCQACGQQTYMAARRGFRLADQRCLCGGVYRMVNQRGGGSLAKGKKMGVCPVCGKRRLEGRACFYHAYREVADAKQAAGA